MLSTAPATRRFQEAETFCGAGLMQLLHTSQILGTVLASEE